MWIVARGAANRIREKDPRTAHFYFVRNNYRRESLLRIESSNVGMESARSYRASSFSCKRFEITDYEDAAVSAGDNLSNILGHRKTEKEPDEENVISSAKSVPGTVNQEESEKTESSKNVIPMRNLLDHIRSVRENYQARSKSSEDSEYIRVSTIEYIFELLFRERRERIRDFCKESAAPSIGEGTTTYMGDGSVNASKGYSGDDGLNMLFVDASQVLTAPGYKLSYCEVNETHESEETSFTTKGKVRCADGREIDFNVNVSMSRDFSAYARKSLGLDFIRTVDPLVINLKGSVADVSDQNFYFDIDSDGVEDEIASLGSGSGFLALDKDGNGKIDNGTELFGTASGDGFADLAKYDEDGNGWIDENDAIWKALKVWTKDENGEDILYTLAQAGVGAICLQRVATDFSVTNTDTASSRAQIRNSGVFLYEDGNVGTIQHVDMVKFQKEA